ILVRFEAVAVRACPYVMALHVAGLPAEARVQLPITGPHAARRQLLERVFGAAYLDRDTITKHDQIIVRWPADLAETSTLSLRLQTPNGKIYAERQDTGKEGATANLGKGFQVSDGLYQVLLLPPPEEYYEQQVRVTRALPLRVLTTPYSQTPYGSF